MMDRKPIRREYKEEAPEIVALDQPNSVSNGLKKTPKVLDIPHATIWIQKAAVTII